MTSTKVVFYFVKSTAIEIARVFPGLGMVISASDKLFQTWQECETHETWTAVYSNTLANVVNSLNYIIQQISIHLQNYPEIIKNLNNPIIGATIKELFELINCMEQKLVGYAKRRNWVSRTVFLKMQATAEDFAVLERNLHQKLEVFLQYINFQLMLSTLSHQAVAPKEPVQQEAYWEDDDSDACSMTEDYLEDDETSNE